MLRGGSCFCARTRDRGWSGTGAGLGQRFGARMGGVLRDGEPRLAVDRRRPEAPCARMGDERDDQRERDEDGSGARGGEAPRNLIIRNA